MISDEVIEDMVRKIATLEEEQKRLASLTQIFPIFNEEDDGINLTSDQSNFPLGDYGIISRVPTANRIIRGITNGYRGRFLLFRNDSLTFTITFTNNDALASVGNKIATCSGASVILGTRQTALFYHREFTSASVSYWVLMFPIA